MANTIRVKRSSVDGRIPTTSDLELGEIAINTYMGKMFIKQKRGLVESIVQIGAENIFTYSLSEPVSPLNGDMWMNTLDNVLSIYVDGFGWEIAKGMGPQGPTGTGGALGNYMMTTDSSIQYSDGPDIPKFISFGGFIEGNGVSLSNDHTIFFNKAGTYVVVYTLQIQNEGDDPDIVNVWGELNGTVTATNSRYVVPGPSNDDGNIIKGYLVARGVDMVTVSAGEFYQMKWTTKCDEPYGMSITSLPADGVIPSANGVEISVFQVMYFQLGITVGPTPPANPTLNDIWIDTN